MVKSSSFRPNSSLALLAGSKSPLVVALCALLLIQPVQGWAQEPVAHNNPQPNAASTSEVSEIQPSEELPSAPVPQSPAQPQQQSQPSPQTEPQGQTPEPPKTQQPVGTAAAPLEKPTGVAGSRPAGAAIAPAKQRRVRAIVISLGLILAGAGAIGAVAGMSKASHSQP